MQFNAAMRRCDLTEKIHVLAFFVNFSGFKVALSLSPGAGIGIGCWMYKVMGESELRILRLAMPFSRSSYVLFGKSAASHHSASGGGSLCEHLESIC